MANYVTVNLQGHDRFLELLPELRSRTAEDPGGLFLVVDAPDGLEVRSLPTPTTSEEAAAMIDDIAAGFAAPPAVRVYGDEAFGH